MKTLEIERAARNIPFVKSTMVDDQRRIEMPPECPPHSAVTIQQLDENTWLIKKQLTEVPDKTVKLVMIPFIEKLPDDPQWEAIEAKLATHATRNLPEPE